MQCLAESYLLVRALWYYGLLLLKIKILVAWENEFYELVKTIVQMFISLCLDACVEVFDL